MHFSPTLPAAQLAVIIALLLAATLIHEGGHAAAAAACGFRIKRVRVGPLKIARDRERNWTVGFRADMGGEVYAAFRTVPGKWARWRCIAMFAGGPLANIVASLILWPFALRSKALEAPFGCLLLFSAGVGLLNLVPFRSKGRTTDGAKLLSLLGNGAAKDELIFRASLPARIEEAQSLRLAAPAEALEKLKALVQEAESIAGRRNKQDLAEFASRLKKLIERAGETGSAAPLPDASPSAEPTVPQ